MLGLSLPFANGHAEAASADGFAPNAFIRIGEQQQVLHICRLGDGIEVARIPGSSV